MSKLKDVEKKMMNEELKELEDYSNIISTLEPIVPSIPLIDFETYLLPYITGEIERTETNVAVYIANFTYITKSHHIGINIIGPDGDIKYKLPPLLSDTNIANLDNIAFTRIVNKVNSYKDNPMRANRLLSDTTKAIMENLDINEHQAELAKILYDYRDRLKNKDIIKEEEKEEDLFDY